MELSCEQIESALVSWITTFPKLSKLVHSFDDLFDGIIICEMLKQIDPAFSFPSVSTNGYITLEESKLLYRCIQEYLKSDIVDEDASMSGDQVLNVDSVIVKHNHEELEYLLKIIIGVAMKCGNNREYISRITSLNKGTQEVLMFVINEVISTMIPSKGDKEFGILPQNDSLEFRDFDDLNEAPVDGMEEDWGNWGNDDTPSEPLSSVLTEDRNVSSSHQYEQELRQLQEELMQKKIEVSDLESSRSSILAERDSALADQEKLQETIETLRKENLFLQMKMERESHDNSREVTPSAQLAAAQGSLLQRELEKAEEESVALRDKLASLSKELMESKVELNTVKNSSQAQIDVLLQQVQQLQKIEQVAQMYKKQLQEGRSEKDDIDALQKRIRELESTARLTGESEGRISQLMTENRSLQNDVLKYQQRGIEIEEQVAEGKKRERELRNDVSVLREKIDSLQSMIPSNQTDAYSPSPAVSRSSTAIGLDVLMSDSSPIIHASLTQIEAEIDVKSTQEYLEQANELLLANEQLIALNKKVELLHGQMIDMKRQQVTQQEKTLPSPVEGDTISKEQHRLLVLKLTLKQEELVKMEDSFKKVDGERSLCLSKIAQLQSDNQEMTEDLAVKVTKCIDLEERKNKLGGKMKALLGQMQQMDVNNKSLIHEVTKEKDRSASLFDINSREEEVMFRCIHKLGKSMIMHYYVTDLENYKPKGWLARVRASQAKII